MKARKKSHLKKMDVLCPMESSILDSDVLYIHRCTWYITVLVLIVLVLVQSIMIYNCNILVCYRMVACSL